MAHPGGGGDSKPQIDWIDVPALEAAGEIPVGTAACLSYLPVLTEAYPDEFPSFDSLVTDLEATQVFGFYKLNFYFYTGTEYYRLNCITDATSADSSTATKLWLKLFDEPTVPPALPNPVAFSQLALGGIEPPVVSQVGVTMGGYIFETNAKALDGTNLLNEKNCLNLIPSTRDRYFTRETTCP